MDNKQIAIKIKQLAKENNTTIKKMAQDIGQGKNIINSLEKQNSSPSFDTICKIADYFGVSIDYIAGRRDEKTYTIQSNKSIYGDIGHIQKNVRQDELSNEVLENFNRLSFQDKSKVINLIAELNEVSDRNEEIKIVASPTRAKAPEVSQKSIEAVKKIMEEIEEE